MGRKGRRCLCEDSLCSQLDRYALAPPLMYASSISSFGEIKPNAAPKTKTILTKKVDGTFYVSRLYLKERRGQSIYSFRSLFPCPASLSPLLRQNSATLFPLKRTLSFGRSLHPQSVTLSLITLHPITTTTVHRHLIVCSFLFVLHRVSIPVPVMYSHPHILHPLHPSLPRQFYHTILPPRHRTSSERLLPTHLPTYRPPFTFPTYDGLCLGDEVIPEK